MPAKPVQPSTKASGWEAFDRIVAAAAPDGAHSNPWAADETGQLGYEPDYTTLAKLLGVPLRLRAKTTTGVPALALDVWLSYELRRAGFDADAVWPRPTPPRVLPAPVASLLSKLKGAEREALWKRLSGKTAVKGAVASEAKILGKNYRKQVDVVMSDWATGPELLISTKRMDSSFGKNAPNRVEESYGDAKNLRLRHPMAALGFVFGLRSTAFAESPDTADWIIDLLQKLGREDDAYHAVSLIVIEYGSEYLVDESGNGHDDESPPEKEAPFPDDGALFPEEGPGAAETADRGEVDKVLASLPEVSLQMERVPAVLRPEAFLTNMVERVLDATPVDFHREARARRKNPRIKHVL